MNRCDGCSSENDIEKVTEWYSSIFSDNVDTYLCQRCREFHNNRNYAATIYFSYQNTADFVKRSKIKDSINVWSYK